MLSSDELSRALVNIPTQVFARSLYRATDLEALFGFHHNPPYPSPRPLWDLGASIKGARFTPRGGPRSLYMAEDPATAYEEASQISAIVADRDPTLVNPIPPKVTCSARVHLETVLDLTIPSVQDALGTSVAELTGSWRLIQDRGQVPPTQLLGQSVFSSRRVQAIRYPSAVSAGHTCIVIFSERLKAPAFVEIFDPFGILKGRIPP